MGYAKMKTKISIIILNFNNPGDTIECIDSLMKRRIIRYDN
jgi:GT2 family glycosyltransferase